MFGIDASMNSCNFFTTAIIEASILASLLGGAACSLSSLESRAVV